jgi:hypothetical protein
MKQIDSQVLMTALLFALSLKCNFLLDGTIRANVQGLINAVQSGIFKDPSFQKVFVKTFF